MLEVTQADRELFITLSNADGQMAERILCGQAFTWEVEQIARHRLAEREAVVKWLRDQADESDTNALVARLERASGPCRELDAAIAVAIGEYTRDRLRPGMFFHKDSPNISGHGIPAYTASIDSALTLVPEGWGGSIHFSEDRPDCELHCTVALGRSYPTNASIYAEKSGKDAGRSALALAICLAAIRVLDCPH